ncbi:MAG: phenylacetate--CoA ligase family protein, partial [Candidatus Helarchaeota archaeon]
MKNIRWYVFWVVDFLKGRPVRKYFNEVKNCYINGTSTENTQTKIRQLIKHAVKTTEFYSTFDEDIALNQLPVVNKVIYKQNYDKFLSSQYKNAKSNRIISTSGSTGIPFSMVQNKNKIHHNTGAGIFLLTLGNYYIGMKQAYIRIWVERHKKTGFRCFMENVSKIDAFDLKDSGVKDFLQEIYQKKIKSILSFASSLTAINRYINNHPSALKGSSLQSITSQSEALSESVRHELAEKFSCVVKSLYSNNENGIMGIQDKDGPEYYINTSSYFIEFLRLDEDFPVKEGELGRIVVTDLHNDAFPILRYDTGDLAKHKIIRHNDRHKLIIDELFGRRTDTIFDSNGIGISPYAISSRFADLDGIKQWQLVQVDQRKYRLIINLQSNSFDEELAKKLLLQVLGENAHIE